MQIIDVAPGNSFILQHCGCRRHWGYTDDEHFYGCMFFETHERISRRDLGKITAASARMRLARSAETHTRKALLFRSLTAVPIRMVSSL
jgi:hypothetical protein